MRFSILVMFAISLLFLSAFPTSLMASSTDERPDFGFSVIPHENWIAQKVTEELKALTLEQKIGQLFIIGVRGKSLTKETIQKLRAIKPGGVLLFGMNISSAGGVHRFNTRLQQFAIEEIGTPLFIAVDQEGDKVTRIKTSPQLISPLSIGQTKDPELAYKKGKAVGQILHALGFNMNLAPVLDLADPEKASFIGTRSYSNDPDVVSIMSDFFIKGQKEGGVIATAKHYPSHGHIEGDSHYNLTSSKLTLEQLFKRDLIPYQHLINNNQLDSILVAHVAFPRIDGREIPATFSKQLVSTTLRDKLHFTGISMTDDLEMAGAKIFDTSKEKALQALNAGNDLLMFAWNSSAQIAAAKGLVEAVKSGELSMDRVDQSVRRILTLKHKYNVGPVKPLSPLQRKRLIVNKDLRELTRDVLVSLSQAKENKSSDAYLVSRKQPALVFSAYRQFAVSFSREFKKGSVKYFPLTSKFRANNLINALNQFPDSTVFFHMTGSRTSALLNAVGPRYSKRFVVINSMTPGDIKVPSLYGKIFNYYSNYPWLGQAVAKKVKPKRPVASQPQLKEVTN